MNLLLLVLVVAFITVVGGGIGYIVWLKTRPKKQTWKAQVWTLSEGVQKNKLDGKGKPIKDLALHDLKPYIIDTIELIIKPPGLEVYRLQKLNKPVPPVSAEIVDNFGVGERIVNVLYAQGSCTLLNKGYEKDIGKAVYDPVPADRINLLKGELAIKKSRLQSEKDILQAITPWIVAGITMLALIGIVYIVVQGMIEVSDSFNEGAEKPRSAKGVAGCETRH